MNGEKEIFVYFDHEVQSPALMGVLSVHQNRGKEIFSFEFDRAWLRSNPIRMLDPELQFYGGAQWTEKLNFGLFMDSAPDRWGRKLMQRREALRARAAGESAHVLFESDYLLGVYDETRMGALRFKLDRDGAFVNNDIALSTPPLARLRELEEACRHLESWTEGDEHAKWLSMLLAPGSSLGGARPKANVAEGDRTLWIAKFPAKNDEVDVGAWEYLTMTLAQKAGLRTSPCRLEKFSKEGSTYLTKRFDRNGTKRIHFASAMTLLGKNDGADALSGASYLDLAEFISRFGAEPERDLLELWKRIVFSIAVSNTDDHLRNHGFILTDKGWVISPLYDVNPNPQGYGLSLNVSDSDNALSFDLAREVADLFRVKLHDAEKEIQSVRAVVAEWRTLASQIGISRAEQEMMQGAFSK